MNKPIRALLIVTVVVLVSLTGCNKHKKASKADPNGVWMHIKQTASQGQRNINKIELGMSKAQVQEIMGTKTHYHDRSYRQPTIVTHPSKREMIEHNSEQYEILYYYTAYAKRDAALTPVILNSGKVVGLGWSYLNKIK